MSRHLSKSSACAALLLASVLSLPGQEKPVPDPSTAPKTEPAPTSSKPSRSPDQKDEALVLSPFTVQAEEDEGYSSRYTLAGTRVRTDVRDVGSSITIVTPKFMKDTNSTNLVDLLVYQPNTEVAGPGGNFLGNGDSESAGAVLYGTTRIRGLVPADNTRDLFLTNIPFDSYNSGGVDIQRGANSILFGIGSPGGIINTRVNHAGFKNTRNVEAQVATFGSTRLTADYNQVLVDQELAFRISALDKATKYQQEPAFQDDKRIFGSLRWDPRFLNRKGMKTTLEVSYEDGKIDSNLPRNAPPGDFITPFYLPMFNSVRATGLQFRSAITSAAAIPYVGNAGEQLTTAAQITTFLQGQQDSTAWRENISGQNNWIGDGFTQGISGYSKYATTAKLPGWTILGFKDRVLEDDTIFDFYNQLLDGNTKAEFQYFKALNAVFRQSFLDDTFGYELVFDRQEVHSGGRSFLDTKGYAINIDIMGTLPGGIKGGTVNPAGGTFAEVADPINPGYGRPAVFSGSRAGFNWTDDIKRTGRLTAFYDLNFKKIAGADSFLGRVFGRNTFTLLGSTYQVDTINASGRDYYTSDSFVLNNASSSSARTIYVIDYLSSAKYLTSAHNAQLSRLQDLPVPGSNQPIKIFNTTTKLYSTETFNTVINSLLPEGQRTYSAGGKRRGIVDSAALVWQGYWFDGALVPLIGYRRDTAYEKTGRAIPSQNVRNLTVANPYSPDWTLNRKGPESTVNSKTYSLVTHLPSKWRDRLPGRADISLIANKSENFDPRPGRTDVVGRALPNPQGDTKEFGVAFSLLDDKLYVKIAKYKTTIYNADVSSLSNISSLRALEIWAVQSATGHLGLNGAPAGPGNPFFGAQSNYGLSSDGHIVTYRPPGPFVGSPYLGLAGDPFPAGTLRAPYTQAELDKAYATQVAASRAYLANLPSDAFLIANGVNLEDFKSGASTIRQGSLPSAVVTGTTISKGGELELVANPVRGLNVIMNVSKTEATRVNMARSYLEYVEDRFKAFSGPAGDVRLWSNGDNETPVDPYHTSGGGPAGGGLARTSFELSIQNAIRKFQALEGSNVPEMKPWSANLTVNYAFQSDNWLKGFNVGGAYRWQDKNVIGFPVIKMADGRETEDVDHPYYGDSESTIDFWVGYNRKLTKKIDWRLRLGVRNAFYNKDLILTSVQPDGVTPGAWRIPEPRVISLSNSFDF